MRWNKLNILAVIMMISVMSIGAVRKKENPILDTQTNPIAFKQKMEELKEGEKGAPTPSFEHYSKEEFLVDPPVSEVEEAPSTEQLNEIPEWGEPIPEDLSESEPEPGSEPSQGEEDEKTIDWWFE